MVNLKSITRTLPKRPNQFRYRYPKLRAKPYLPKYKRESIIIRTTLDVSEESKRLQDKVWTGTFFYYESMKRKLI
jgi:hypothetical protein